MLNIVTDSIRREIRVQLVRRDMNQGQLAQAVGISEVQLSRMMQGSSKGSVTAWQKILDELGLELVVKPREER